MTVTVVTRSFFEILTEGTMDLWLCVCRC